MGLIRATGNILGAGLTAGIAVKTLRKARRGQNPLTDKKYKKDYDNLLNSYF